MKIKLSELKSIIAETINGEKPENDTYYWVSFGNGPPIPAHYESDVHADGSPNQYPWMTIGSDEPATREHVTVLKKLTYS